MLYNISDDDKQSSDELDYYTDFENFEVRLIESQDEPYDLYDSSDDNMNERDHLDIVNFCSDLEFYEYSNEFEFNYLEV